jgi:excisionase family DNA binding protein
MVREVEWYTTEQAAEYLQITPEVVRQKAREGVLASSRVGQEFRFSKDSLDRWLRAGGDAQTRAGADLDEARDKLLPYLEKVQEATIQHLHEALNIDRDTIMRALQRTRRRILAETDHLDPDADSVPVATGDGWCLMLVRDALAGEEGAR